MNSQKVLIQIASKGPGIVLKTVRRNHQIHHPYKNIKYISSKLSDDLVTNVIYKKNGIIVLNKPYGVSFSDGQPKAGDFEVSLHTLLPFLKEKLNCKKIFPAKIPEKYASGVSIFCTEEHLQEKIRKCLRSMRAQHIPPDQYDCIVVGQPSIEAGQYDGGVTVELSPNGKQKRICLVQDSSKGRVRRGEVKNTFIEHDTVSSNELASRLRINISRTKYHGLRVYAATHLASPLLGDRVFGGLVRQVLGKPVLVDMWSPAASLPPKLPKELLSKLDLDSREDIEIPLHLHLSKVSLINFPIKTRTLEFHADPPEFFTWTCSRLKFSTEDKYSTLSEGVKQVSK